MKFSPLSTEFDRLFSLLLYDFFSPWLNSQLKNCGKSTYLIIFLLTQLEIYYYTTARNFYKMFLIELEANSYEIENNTTILLF
jgi:hypothetical protein